MAGRNNYPSFSNGDDLGFAEYLEALEQWADDLIFPTKANAAALPAAGTVPVGRQYMVEDTGTLYINTVSGWAPIASPFVTSGAFASFGTNISAGSGMDTFKRDGVVYSNFYVTKSSGNIGNGELLATLNPLWRPAGVVAAATGIPNSFGLRIDGSNGQITTVGSIASATLLATFSFRQVN